MPGKYREGLADLRRRLIPVADRGDAFSRSDEFHTTSEEMLRAERENGQF